METLSHLFLFRKKKGKDGFRKVGDGREREKGWKVEKPVYLFKGTAVSSGRKSPVWHVIWAPLKYTLPSALKAGGVVLKIKAVKVYCSKGNFWGGKRKKKKRLTCHIFCGFINLRTVGNKQVFKVFELDQWLVS